MSAADNKIALVTGADGGIGKETALQLARLGYTIAFTSRNETKAKGTLASLKQASPAPHRYFIADLADREQVFALADQVRATYDHLDALVNNAGVFNDKYRQAPDGMEHTLAVNVRAPFMLCNLLLDLLNYAADGRIVNVSSALHYRGAPDWQQLGHYPKYSGYQAYADSKLLLTTMTHELGRRTNELSIGVASLHPGVITSGLFRDYQNKGPIMRSLLGLATMFMTTPEKGARGSVMLASSPQFSKAKTLYLDKTKPATPHKDTLVAENGKKLWTWLQSQSDLTTLI